MNIVIVDCFDTWEHRVDLLYKVLAEEGHNVRCLLSDYRHFEKAYRTDKKEGFEFFHAESYHKNMSVARLRSHLRLSRDIFSYIDKQSDNINVLWVLAPPNCFVRDASKVKKNHPNIKLIIDLIDLWPETMPVGKIKPLLFPWKGLRDKYLRYADTVVTECDLYQKKLTKGLEGLDVHTLYLARDDQGYKPDLQLPNDKIALCYLGSINNIIDIDAIKRVIDNCEKYKPVLLHIVGDGEKKNELVKIAEAAGAEVIDHGKVYDRTEKQKIFDACHYGLNIMKESVCVGLTMKSIDYFEFGLPIINNIKGDTWDIIEKYKCGVNIDDEFHLSEIKDSYSFMRNRRFFESCLTKGVFAKRVRIILGSPQKIDDAH